MNVINSVDFFYLEQNISRLFLDKLSFTTVNFIRSEDNLALLHLFMLLGFSEHML